MNLLKRLAQWWPGSGRSSRRSLSSAPRSTRRYAPRVEELEVRCLPANSVVAAFGAGVGGGPVVTVLFTDGSQKSFFAFNPAFTGGVSVTTGQVNGTGVPDVIVGVGRGGASEVKVFDGAQLVAGQVVTTADFMAFPASFTGGVTLAVGHIDGTAHADVVVGAGPGGGTRVKVFDGADLAQGQAVATADFNAFEAAFQGHFFLATGPVNGTSHDDIVVGAGRGGGPMVRVFDGAALAQGQAVATANFMAFPASFTGGVTLAVGHINGTTHADVVAAPGPGGASDIKVFDGADLAQGQAVTTAEFFAFNPAFLGGVSLAVGHFNGTANADVAVGAGPGGGPVVEVFDGAHLAQGQAVTTATFYPFPANFMGGVQVISAPLDQSGHETLVVVPGPGGGPLVVVVNTKQIVINNFVPLFSFFAFPGFFLGGFGFGYGAYYGSGGYFSSPFAGSSFSGGSPSGFTGGSPSGFTGGSPSGFTGSSGGFSGGSGGFSSGGFSSGGFSGGGFSGGGSGGGGSSLRAAGGSLRVGGNAQGAGLYLAPGQLSLASLTAGTSGYPNAQPQAATAGTLATPGQLQSVIEEAISWWDQAGIDPAQDQLLRTIQFQIVNLGGDTLGRTNDGIIHLSPDAAGYGWFIDTPSTLQNGFGRSTANGLVASPNSPAAGHMDLATVIAHEMGLAMGLKETPTHGDIMAPFLSSGMRRLPTAHDLDAVFSQVGPSG